MLAVRALAHAAVLACAVVAAGATNADAQAFISPFLGQNFSGDAACPVARPACDERNATAGVSFGNLNALIGFEQELSYSKGLLKDPLIARNSVLTIMSNVVVGPRIGDVRPYGAGGFGLMRLTTKLTPSELVQLSNTDLGWNIGGGVMATFGHIGVRGDIRFFHGFGEIELLGLPVSDLKLDYGRAIIGFVLQ